VHYSFIVIGDQNVKGIAVERITEFFPHYFCAGIFPNDLAVLETIAEVKPHLIFFNINTDGNTESLTIKMLGKSYEYLTVIPYVVILCPTNDFAMEAIKNGISDYLNNSNLHTLGESLSKFEKRVPIPQQKSICIKSYSDYHFLKYDDIVFLKADNNTTDFKTTIGSKVTAYKTLKYFESVLPPYFIRIHKSYIVNIHFITRIQFSKSRCYLSLNEELPFSNSYRGTIEQILHLNLIGS